MNNVINAFLLIYAGLFPIVNPVGSAPIFLGFTQQSTGAERHRLAARIAINGFLLLLGSLLAGSYLLEFFGISVPVVRIAGGFVVAAFGWKLLNEASALIEHRADGDGQGSGPIDSFYPLTMPLTVGPGSISTAITLGSQRPQTPGGLADLAMIGAGAVAGLIAITTTIYFCYRFADRIIAALGASGTNVVIRLSAFVLLCIGVQIVWNGYSALVGHA